MSTTYTSLVNRIKVTTENDETDFNAEIQHFIERAESRLIREIDSYGVVQYATSNLTVGDPFVTKPNNTLIIKNLNILRDGTRINLLQKTDEFLNDYWPQRTSTGIPRYYANFGFDRLLIAPTPVSAYDCEMSYIVQPTAATSVHQENFFTEYCSNALFYASMKEACMFMKNYSGAQVWEQEYQRAFTDLLNESRRTRQDDMRNNASPAGGDNTLVKGSN
tara:strand:+ start:141 stop:800 length:660 start_codon:yes stop_codon:yes gene_type:complete